MRVIVLSFFLIALGSTSASAFREFLPVPKLDALWTCSIIASYGGADTVEERRLFQLGLEEGKRAVAEHRSGNKNAMFMYDGPYFPSEITLGRYYQELTEQLLTAIPGDPTPAGWLAEFRNRNCELLD